MDYFEGKLEPKEKEQIMIALCKLIFKVSPSFKKKKSLKFVRRMNVGLYANAIQLLHQLP